MRTFDDTDRLRSVAGIVAVILNIVAVAALYQIPSAYRIARLGEWSAAVAQHPLASAISAAAFTFGLVALALWAEETGRSLGRPLAKIGGRILAYGSLMNAVGTVAPLVVAFHLEGGSVDVPRALLGFSITLDAFFNATLFVGLTCFAATWPDHRSAALKWLALAAGLASLPVAAQAVYDPAASLLMIAGPLWLVFITAESVGVWRRNAKFARR